MDTLILGTCSGASEHVPKSVLNGKRILYKQKKDDYNRWKLGGVFVEKENEFELPVHFIMATFGGFLGAYAILARMRVFGSAQTANLIELVCDILGRNLEGVLTRVMALVVYGGAIALAAVLIKKVQWNLKYLAIFLDAFAILVAGFLPEDMDPVAALYPVFFVTAFQWCVFQGAKGYTSSTIFSTNNLKQTVFSITEYFIYRKEENVRKQKAEKAVVFGGTLFSFHIGVGFGYLMWLQYGIHSVWFGSIPLLAGAVLLVVQDLRAKAYIREQDSVSCL